MVRTYLKNPVDPADELTVMEWTEGRLTTGRYKIIVGELMDCIDSDRRATLVMDVFVDHKAIMQFELSNIPGIRKQLLFVSKYVNGHLSYGKRLVKVFNN